MHNQTELHGLSQKTTSTDVARHEAGHILMLWLLDCHLLGSHVSEQEGVTISSISSNGTASLRIPSLPLLHVLAGMAMDRDNEVIDDLRQHIDSPEYFQQDTDARKVATMIRAFDGSHISALHHHLLVLSRFRNRFRRPYRELLTLLLETPHTIGVVQAYGLFNRWDVEFGFDRRPKSDYVIRALMWEYGQKPPKCKWLGWDMKPLDEWTYKQPPLNELVELARGMTLQLQ